jgi:hypothetical protein
MFAGASGTGPPLRATISRSFAPVPTISPRLSAVVVPGPWRSSEIAIPPAELIPKIP